MWEIAAQDGAQIYRADAKLAVIITNSDAGLRQTLDVKVRGTAPFGCRPRWLCPETPIMDRFD
jgi:hypothetical protein